MSWVAAAVGVVSIGAGIYKSEKASSNAKKLAANRPKYTSSPEYGKQLSLAESELSNGLSADAQKTYEQDTDRDLSNSLDTILKGGGDVNMVGSVFDGSQRGRQRLTLVKENLRLNQINNLVRAQENVETDRERAFGFNVDAPYKDAAQANAQARMAGEQQIWSGIDTAGAGIARGIQANKSQNQLDNYFNNNNSTDNSHSADWYGSDKFNQYGFTSYKDTLKEQGRTSIYDVPSSIDTPE